MAKSGLIKIIASGAAIIALFFPASAKYQELRTKNRMLEAKIKTLQKQMKTLEEEKRRLETDITYIEQKAREKIGLVRRGEIVIKAPQKR